MGGDFPISWSEGIAFSLRDFLNLIFGYFLEVIQLLVVDGIMSLT